jgi:hypothetical protein
MAIPLERLLKRCFGSIEHRSIVLPEVALTECATDHHDEMKRMFIKE